VTFIKPNVVKVKVIDNIKFTKSVEFFWFNFFFCYPFDAFKLLSKLLTIKFDVINKDFL